MSEQKPAKLPGLPAVSTGNAALDRWIQSATERFEVREGARGSDLERVVTQRDLSAANFIRGSGNGGGGAGRSGGVLVQGADGSYTSISVDAFGDEIRKTRLFQHMMTKLDDPARFDDLPEKVRNLLLVDLANEAAQRGAAITEVDYKYQSATESLAYRVDTVTAAVADAQAGIRQTAFASATAEQATAGLITQIVASLGNYYQDGTPGRVNIEESLIAVADRVTGLSAEWMIKLNAGGAVAGIGLSATEDPMGATKSAFIVQADNFGLIGTVNFAQAAIPTAANTTPSVTPAINQTWYNTTTKLYYRAAVAGATTIGPGGWVAFTPAVPFGVDTATGTTYINGSLRVGPGGPTIEESAGKYTDYIFRRSATLLSTAPTGDTPASWFDTPPTGADPLYSSIAEKTAAGVLIGTWSTPFRLDGAAGTTGPYTVFQYAVNTSLTVAPASGWSNTTLSPTTGQFLWMRAGTVTPPATAPTVWGAGYRVSGEQGAQGNTGNTGSTGSNGTNGTAGTRGTIVTNMTGLGIASNAAAAIMVITSASGALPATPIKGDIVSYPAGALECTAAGNPGTWSAMAAYINGSLLVTGTVVATTLKAVNGVVGVTIAGGTSATNANGDAITNGIYVYQNSATLYGLYVKNAGKGAAFFETGANGGYAIDAYHNSASGTGTGVYARSDSTSTGSTGLTAKGFHGARIGNKNDTQIGLIGLGNLSKCFYAEAGSFGPFTGSHDALVPLLGWQGAAGDIVVDVAVVARKGLSDTLCEVALSSAPNQKAAIGVFVDASADWSGFIPAALVAGHAPSDPSKDSPSLPFAVPGYAAISETYQLASINALGEGQLNVCGEGGDLQAGDLIVSSSIPGKGMRQSDDLVRSYTVAKCREAVTFSSPTEVKLVACVYLCG